MPINTCTVRPFLPHPPIETPVLDRLCQMLLADMLGSIEIGDGAGNLEDARVAAGGEAEALGDEFEEAVTGFVRLAMLADQARRHLGVAVDAAVVQPLLLYCAAGFDTQGNDLGCFGVGTVDKIAIFDGWDFDLDVDTIEEGAGDSGTIALYSRR